MCYNIILNVVLINNYAVLYLNPGQKIITVEEKSISWWVLRLMSNIKAAQYYLLGELQR